MMDRGGHHGLVRRAGTWSIVAERRVCSVVVVVVGVGVL